MYGIFAYSPYSHGGIFDSNLILINLFVSNRDFISIFQFISLLLRSKFSQMISAQKEKIIKAEIITRGVILFSYLNFIRTKDIILLLVKKVKYKKAKKIIYLNT